MGVPERRGGTSLTAMARRQPPEPVPEDRRRPVWLRSGALASVVTTNGYEVIGVLMPMTVYGEDALHMPLSENRTLPVCIGEMLDSEVQAVYPYVRPQPGEPPALHAEYTRFCDGCGHASVTGPGRIAAERTAATELGWQAIVDHLYCPTCVTAVGVRALLRDARGF